jgi:urease accessory protein
MIRATVVLPVGSWSGAPADTVLLDFEARHRRRVAMSAKGGIGFLLDLTIAAALRHGDGLLLEDGRIIAVEAAVEPLAEVTASDPAALARFAWHLGSQQVPVQFLATHLRIRRDAPVEAALVESGARIASVRAPFEPDEDGFGPASRSGRFSQSHGFAYSHGFHRHPGSRQEGEHGYAEAFGDAYAVSRSPTQSYTAAGSRAEGSGRDTRDSDSRKPGEAGDGADRHRD